jgi:hypothetical protein
MKNLSLYLYNYIHNIWDTVCQNDERTVSLTVNLENDIAN